MAEIGLSLVLTPDAVDAIDECSDNNEQKLVDVILLWEDVILLNNDGPLAEQIKRWSRWVVMFQDGSIDCGCGC